jgi:transcriptional regulator with XRE-family HTH domain
MTSRKRLFRICLAANDETIAEFSKKLGITPSAISRFFAGFKSEPIRKAIDFYIAINLHKVRYEIDQIEKIT